MKDAQIKSLVKK